MHLQVSSPECLSSDREFHSRIRSRPLLTTTLGMSWVRYGNPTDPARRRWVHHMSLYLAPFTSDVVFSLKYCEAVLHEVRC
jgi:hypothetical protein